MSSNYFSAGRVKRSLIYYLFGRGMTAVISVLYSLILLRFLDIGNYAAYTVISGGLMVIALLSSGGAERILPKFLTQLRQDNNYRGLAAYAWKLLLYRISLFVVFFAPVVLFSGPLSKIIGTHAFEGLIGVIAAYALFSTIALHTQKTFQALLLQKHAVHSLAIDGFMRIGIVLYVIGTQETLTLERVFQAQVVSSLLATLYLLYQLHHMLAKLNQAESTQIQSFTNQELVRFGWINWLQQLSGVGYSSSMSKVLAGAFLTTFETALVGFAFVVKDMVQRYMPAVLMLGLIEPVFLERYRQSGSIDVLNQMASLVLKFNLFIILPFTAWIVVGGQPVLDLVSNDKFADSSLVIGCLLVVLASESHRLVLQLVCNALNQSQLLLSSNLIALFILPVEVALMIYFGLPGLVVGLFVASLLRNMLIIRSLRTMALAYRPDWRGVRRITYLVILASLLPLLLISWSGSLINSVASGLLLLSVFLLLAWRWKVFTQEERVLIKRFVPRRLWFW